MNIDLKVNSQNINLGMPLDVSSLASSKIKKMGFLSSILISAAKKPGDMIFWSKNPSISCFDEKASTFAYPKGLDYDPSETVDPRMMNGTTCLFFYNYNKLRATHFQVIGNRIAATMFLNVFFREALNKFGEPKSHYGMQATWHGQSTLIKCHLDAGEKDCLVSWERI